MAYTTTYADLVADLQDIVDSDNPEFVAEIPNIIARAQDIVQRDLGLDIWRTYPLPTVATVISTPTVARQATWLDVRSIFIASTGSPLEKRTIDWVRMYGSATGTPRYWAEMSDSVIRLAPIPSAVLTLEFDVIARHAPLAGGNQTNWFTQHAADLLLLQSLIGAEMYIDSPERTAQFMQAYQLLIGSAIKELRTQERAGYEPTREASRPSMQPGERA
jgi:hypothetical protein